MAPLRNKRPDFSGRPPCKGVAIGVAKRGGARSGERTLRIPPSCSVPVSHAGGPHVASFVVDRPCACVRACVRAGVAQCAASSEEKRPAKKRVGTLNKKKASHVRCEAEKAESGARALARAAMRFLCGCPCVIRLWVRTGEGQVRWVREQRCFIRAFISSESPSSDGSVDPRKSV